MRKFPRGFTIVELLVVIVVIGILATVIVVAYNGISGRAVTASLQSDLTQAKKQIESYYTVNGVYPTANNCTNTLTTEICLKASPSNTLSYTTFNLNSQTTYSVTATRGTASNTVTGGTTPSIVTDGLVLHLDAGNPASYLGSGTTWTDLSGNNNNGTLINGPTYSSDNGGSIVFDGVNDYVALATVPPIAQGLYSSTVEMVAFRDRSNVFEVMFGGGNFSANQGFYFGFRQYSGNNFMYAYYSNDQDGSTGSSNVAWNHYVASYDTSSQSRYRYFNASLLSPSQSSGVSNTTANRFYIGAFNSGYATSHFQGKISLIRLYNRALSSSEITQNFNATRSRFGI